MAIDSVPEVDRVAVLKSRYAEASKLEIKLKKLNAALVAVVIAERPVQLRRLAQAQDYVKSIMSSEGLPSGFGSDLKIIGNEIISLQEGIYYGHLKPTDLVLSSGSTTIEKVKTLKESLAKNIQASEAPIEELDPTEKMIIKNQSYKEKVPNIEGKLFIVARVPVAFSSSYARNQSSIGYLNMDKLAHAGFKAETLDGYAIIHNQLAIGVNGNELSSYPQVKERFVVNKKDGETQTKIRKREPTLMDMAKDLKKQIEAQTKQKWDFVLEKSYRFKGANWYWVMPSRDVNAFASVFPGGHLKLQSWGFAF